MHFSMLLLVLFVALQIADAVTTYRGLSGSYSNVSEANPLARWAFERFGLLLPIIILKAAMSALGVALALAGGTLGQMALGALSAVGIYVLSNNLRVLRRAA